MRVVWAVGNNVGWPPEVYVLFSREADAQRHARLPSYAFAVFPIPVYDRCVDVPPALRLQQGPSPGIGAAAEEEALFARLLLESGEAVAETAPPTPVHALGAWEQQVALEDGERSSFDHVVAVGRGLVGLGRIGVKRPDLRHPTPIARENFDTSTADKRCRNWSGHEGHRTEEARSHCARRDGRLSDDVLV